MSAMCLDLFSSESSGLEGDATNAKLSTLLLFLDILKPPDCQDLTAKHTVFSNHGANCQ